MKAIDPGPEQSAIIHWEKGNLLYAEILPNEKVLELLFWGKEDYLAIEMIASYGMPVGREVFETCLWIGRFIQAHAPRGYRLVPRLEVKMHLCHSSRANDSSIRQALIDIYGKPGTKKSQGYLYGIKSHLWAAMGVLEVALKTEGTWIKN